jgi:hypothetical protein
MGHPSFPEELRKQVLLRPEPLKNIPQRLKPMLILIASWHD